MEQLRGQVVPSVPAAGTDPAYVPGLVPPGPARTEEEAPEERAAEQQVSEADPSEEAAGEAVPGAGEPGGSGEPEEPGEPGASGEEEEAGGPAFEAADRRGSVTAGRGGVTFRLDGEEAGFRWDEIGAVEIDPSRFGRRFAVAVCTTDRRWYQAEVEAPSRGVLKEWTAQFDAVLDACFEDAS